MPKIKQPESFEVQGDQYVQEKDKIALIQQVVEDLPSADPSIGFTVTFSKGKMFLKYHSFEMRLAEPKAIDEAHRRARKLCSDFMKKVKAEYRKRGGLGALKAKEIKKDAKHDVQKVSLNDRYYYNLTLTYDIHTKEDDDD